jgi:hypothetical protein
MITSSFYTQYFEQLAEQLPELSHTLEKPRFTRMSVQTILSQASGRGELALKELSMILESFDGLINSESPTSSELYYNGGFLLLQHCAQGNLAQQTAIEEKAFSAGLKIIKRMQHDHQESILHGFEVSSMEFDAIGPLFDNAYGYRFGFSFFFHLNLDHNENDWL